MSEKWKRRMLVGFYTLATAVMAASLTYEVLKPKAYADACAATGQPCNLTNGAYACTGGINGGPPIPGCTCDIGNFCTGDGAASKK
jgi:hypothetical protein